MIEKNSADVGANRNRQHGKTQVGGEDAATEAVFRVELQQRGGKDPDG